MLAQCFSLWMICGLCVQAPRSKLRFCSRTSSGSVLGFLTTKIIALSFSSSHNPHQNRNSHLGSHHIRSSLFFLSTIPVTPHTCILHPTHRECDDVADHPIICEVHAQSPKCFGFVPSDFVWSHGVQPDLPRCNRRADDLSYRTRVVAMPNWEPPPHYPCSLNPK